MTEESASVRKRRQIKMRGASSRPPSTSRAKLARFSTGSCDMMSAMGRGRAKTVSMGVGFESKRRMASGHDRSDQRLDPNDVHYPGQIIGEDREGHLGGHLWKRFGQEVRRPHACFHRAERMFDCLSTL